MKTNGHDEHTSIAKLDDDAKESAHILQGFALHQESVSTNEVASDDAEKRNSRKIQTLEIFKKSGPLTPQTYATLADFRPTRAAYTYLLRLHRFGLLKRSDSERGIVTYSLTERGLSRLL